MTKFLHICALFMFVFYTSCRIQDKSDLPKDTVKYVTKDTVTSYGPDAMVRNVKKGKNGTILIAASFAGVFRYDPTAADRKPFTNLTHKIGSHRFWDVLEDRLGNLWFVSTDSGVYYYGPQQAVPGGEAPIRQPGNFSNTSQPGRGWRVMRLWRCMKIEPVTFGSAT